MPRGLGAPSDRRGSSGSRARLDDTLRAGATTGVGSLPHRRVRDAVDYSLAHFDVPVAPTLPRRSPAEGMIAQALLGIDGVTLGQYGSIALDVRRLDPCAPVVTDLGHDGFTGMRTFLEHAARRGHQGPVKWQFVGPVTLGVALTRAGVAVGTAFAVAVRAVRTHLASLADAVAAALPGSPQIVVLDEPWFGDVMTPGFPIAPDPAIDLLSGAMAAVEPVAAVGVHCCDESVDVASLLAAGPDILSVPATGALTAVTGYLTTFLEQGGRVAWGAVATDGPIPVSDERPWRVLSELWGSMVERGCDPLLLRRRSLITTHCGMGLHTPGVAEHVATLTTSLGRRISEEALAGGFALDG
ncbi:MAG: hypothetical protein ACK5OX_15815 [Desertimonas sp.]